MQNYKIICNQTQLAIISSSCETFARVMMGQFDTLCFNILAYLNVPSDRYREIEDLLNTAGKKLWDDGNPGISHDKMPDSARVAWDVYAVMRHMLAFQNCPEGGFGVNFYAPHRSSKEALLEVTPTLDTPDPRPCKERMRDELSELLNVPPDDFQTAIERIRQWKEFYESHHSNL